ncbi:TIM barrel protein [Bacillus cereus group sp. BY112LC]|uniref:sugar phosphate isomerase/epimerase family protein n=1 Tax=Bacillus cereus group sp. BY112LC TaxID=3018086 RepID=UPI0022E2103F|nr:TIM barrel protein [Bacillus cereus group sp. BY112LC]MDA1877169.1 TIM barrel protein [Bacillus cereus group sp. BY112LC]
METKRKFGMFLNTKHIDVKEGIKKAAEFNLDHIQLYALNEKFNLASLPKQEIKNLRNYLFFEGLTVSSLAINFGYKGILSKEIESIITKYKYILDLGLELGTNIITAHIGQIPSNENSVIYEKMQKICYYIGNLSVNTNSFFAIETGSEKAIILEKFLRNINSKGLAINFDPANIISDIHEDPIDSILLLKNYVIQTHIKDCKKINDRGLTLYKETAAGNGEVDFDSLFTTLDKIRFNGCNIIERNDYVDSNDGINQSVKFLRKYMD